MVREREFAYIGECPVAFEKRFVNLIGSGLRPNHVFEDTDLILAQTGEKNGLSEMGSDFSTVPAEQTSCSFVDVAGCAFWT